MQATALSDQQARVRNLTEITTCETTLTSTAREREREREKLRYLQDITTLEHVQRVPSRLVFQDDKVKVDEYTQFLSQELALVLNWIDGTQ